MAIKTSNQITFTEQKKILEIKEYYLATSLNTGVTIDTEGWTTDIQTINYTDKYLWNYEEVVYSIGSSEVSTPVIIGFYGEGNGIANIVNYYQITQDLTAPDTKNTELWSTSAPLLSPTNKYLWNYEIVTYTNGDTNSTEPVLIGVYGDSGTDAITFEIYSTQGFIFKEDMTQIELKIAAFKGADSITDATYTWEWWNDELNDGAGGYEVVIERKENSEIEKKDVTDPNLIVDYSDEFAFSSLRCTMTYNGKSYEDYIVLTSETVIYTSTINFASGSNVFYANDLYLIVYVELYQNGHKVETIATDKYCSGISSVSEDGVITPNLLNADFVDGDKMYFVYQDNDGLYQVVLGEYTSSVWKVIQSDLQYTYANSLYNNIQSNIIAISKESVNKSKNISFTVLKNAVEISNANINVIDSNDPIISDTAPDNPVYSQLWLDTSDNPPILKMFVQIDDSDTGEWVNCSHQIGDAVFTSQPSSYSKGDIWILADGEVCEYTLNGVSYRFEAGSMLKATTSSLTFVASHWIDADKILTELEEDIRQYFKFSATDGLKIGQQDQKFYVLITARRMGFYEVDDNNNAQEVVYISGNAANITNLTVEDSAEFDCNTKFNSEVNFFGFVWKKESNGSLSLAIPS